MLLQYLRPRLFGQLYKWQASQKGFPQEIIVLEKWVQNEGAEIPETIDQSLNWNTSSIRRWLAMSPSLSGVDLRSYFWITRDRVEGILSGVSTIPRHMRQIIFGLMELEADGIFPEELKTQIQQLPTDEQNILLDELEEKLKRAEDKRNLIWVWDSLSAIIPQATQRLFDYLEKAPVRSLPRPLPMKVAAIGRENPKFKARSIEILQQWTQDNQSAFGRAAKEALSQLEAGEN